MSLTNLRYAAITTLLLAALGLSGCASTPSPQHQYLLRAPGTQLSNNAAPSLAISRLTLPDYLYDDALVLLLDDQEIHRARLHRWAEPPHTAISRYLSQRIAARLGEHTDPQPLEVEIQELIGNIDGVVSLRASYRLVDVQGTPRSGRFSQRLRQPADGYPGLVASHTALLDELAVAIAGDLSSQAER